MYGSSFRWFTRAALLGAAVLAVVVAITFAREALRQPRLSSSVVLGADPSSTAPPSAADQPVNPSGFAFLDKPRRIPDLVFVNEVGEKNSLSKFWGRPLVLNIWATWCVPCRKEMPTLDRLQATLAETDALVVPLSIDSQGPSVVKAFYAEIGIKSLGIYVDQSGDTSHLLNAIGIPTTLLVDRNGQELGRKIGPAEWDSSEMMALIRSRLGPRSMTPASGQP